MFVRVRSMQPQRRTQRTSPVLTIYPSIINLALSFSPRAHNALGTEGRIEKAADCLAYPPSSTFCVRYICTVRVNSSLMGMAIRFPLLFHRISEILKVNDGWLLTLGNEWGPSRFRPEGFTSFVLPNRTTRHRRIEKREEKRDRKERYSEGFQLITFDWLQQQNGFIVIIKETDNSQRRRPKRAAAGPDKDGILKNGLASAEKTPLKARTKG